MKNKSKLIDLRTLWDRASKTRKVELESTSVLQPESVSVGISTQPQDLIIQYVVPVTNESQVPNQTNPFVQHDRVTREVIEPKIASTERISPKICSNEPDIATTEPSTLFPIRDGDDS
ncbi:hypothetical protein C2845_PM15G08400 [Panicum miliaceum]|uniref:Uncharacterized protein n=1 Tax=Panicum miliaceum TaxID=4540 RepID=A0A3L6QAC0_PANMI|nr:hypothetical protein C2845_PM15G08400 [Panicum miliaceum]